MRASSAGSAWPEALELKILIAPREPRPAIARRGALARALPAGVRTNAGWGGPRGVSSRRASAGAEDGGGEGPARARRQFL